MRSEERRARGVETATRRRDAALTAHASGVEERRAEQQEDRGRLGTAPVSASARGCRAGDASRRAAPAWRMGSRARRAWRGATASHAQQVAAPLRRLAPFAAPRAASHATSEGAAEPCWAQNIDRGDESRTYPLRRSDGQADVVQPMLGRGLDQNRPHHRAPQHIPCAPHSNCQRADKASQATSQVLVSTWQLQVRSTRDKNFRRGRCSSRGFLWAPPSDADYHVSSHAAPLTASRRAGASLVRLPQRRVRCQTSRHCRPFDACALLAGGVRLEFGAAPAE
jgi:hypothetical protein